MIGASEHAPTPLRKSAVLMLATISCGGDLTPPISMYDYTSIIQERDLSIEVVYMDREHETLGGIGD